MDDTDYYSEEDIVGDDRISREMRDFIEPVEEGEIWGNKTYQPPEEDEHLMTERERETIKKQGMHYTTGLAENKTKPKSQARDYSSLKRLAEKNMRKKRRAMLQESRRWYMKQQALQKHEFQASLKARQPATHTTANSGHPVTACLPTLSPTATPEKYGSMQQVLSKLCQNGSYLYDMVAHLRGTGSKNAPARDMDCAS